MPPLETNEIQGIILRSYASLPVTRFLLLGITNSLATKKWLGDQVPNITFGIFTDAKRACNLAVTAEGLRTLGLKDKNLFTFSPEFREGMVTPHRQRSLGDHDESDPMHWRWGGPTTATVHLLLALYAVDENELNAYHASHKDGLVRAGLNTIGVLDSLTLPGRKEHFGFRDGIAQPYVEGDRGESTETTPIGAGEFILGYTNQYGLLPDTPQVVDAQGDTTMLPEPPPGEQGPDLGRNGSYLVFRQLSQEVRAFWRDLADRTQRHDGTAAPDAAILLASKMLGRWPSGAPLVKYPEADPGGFSDEDAFSYRAEDPEGLKCPIGSHIRRTNPRDSLLDSNPTQSVRLTSRRRMIRRGRPYGAPLVASMDPRELMTTAEVTHEVGLNFLCFNANITNQFEFVQHNWANQPKFESFYEDPDPFIGVQHSCPAGQHFTIPDSPVNRRVTDLKRFVAVRGGAYFFMPSARALRYLTTIKEQR